MENKKIVSPNQLIQTTTYKMENKSCPHCGSKVNGVRHFCPETSKEYEGNIPTPTGMIENIIKGEMDIWQASCDNVGYDCDEQDRFVKSLISALQDYINKECLKRVEIDEDMVANIADNYCSCSAELADKITNARPIKLKQKGK